MNIEMHVHFITKYTHYIKKIVINDEVVSEFDKEIGGIDLSLLSEYVGQVIKVITTRDYGDTTEEYNTIVSLEEKEYGFIVELEEVEI